MSLREIGMNKRHLQKIILFFAPLALAAAGCSDRWKEPKVVINEICSQKFSAAGDDNSRYSDCVELYNPGKTDISLNGCFLTDDERNPQKYSLEGFIVPAGGYTLIRLDQHAGLRLLDEGDQLLLADAGEGVFLDQGTSYGRVKDGGALWAATPGSTNQDANRFRWNSGELFMLYHDWKLHKTEEIIFNCNSGGIPHQHCMDIMIAEKVK